MRNHLEVRDQEILKKLNKQCKINKDLCQKKIKEPTSKYKLSQNTHIAFEQEILGAPTFVVSNQIFWGQDRLEYALDEYFN